VSYSRGKMKWIEGEWSRAMADWSSCSQVEWSRVIGRM